jgi:CRISPR-associated endonuclease/helicase Cas3
MHVPPVVAHYRASDDRWQPLHEHLMGTGKLARGFAEKLGLGMLGELLGVLHDFGKYSQEFQNYLKSAVGMLSPDLDENWVDAGKLKGKVDHSTAGAQLIWHALGNGRGKLATTVGQLAALCIASHHSGLIDSLSATGEDGFIRRMRKDSGRTHLEETRASADAEILTRCQQLLNDPQLLAEVDHAVNGIAQQHLEACGEAPLFQQFGLLVRFVFSCLIAGDRIDTANFEIPDEADLRPAGSYEHWPVLVERLESHLSALSPRHPIDELRQSISMDCLKAASFDKGMFTLTVPTGGGKTLASLRFALNHAERHQMDRVVYVVPFTSIIDQNARVARSILEPDSVPMRGSRIVLEHHSNLTPEREERLDKVLCADWDAPVIYTTMVQFLETLFGSGTRGARRMHQLANAVLIFDEVQTVPVRCVHLFNNALNFLVEQCNSSVVLCTATQPLLDRVDARKGAIRLSAKHSLMPDVSGLFDQLRRIDVFDARKPGGWAPEEIANLALDEFRGEGNCLIIVNTKRAARHLYDLISAELGQDIVFHLSTDMCPAHRKTELDEVRARLADDSPIICVSTQLIEAGVDVDFRVVIRFLAGLDSIAQAAGRCNRNGAPKRGHVHIVNPHAESLGMLPDIEEGKKQAQRVLDNYRQHAARYDHDVLGPKAIEEYYRYYFFQRRADMSYPVSAKDVGASTSLLDLLAGNPIAANAYHDENESFPPYQFCQSFATAARLFKAIDAPTEGIIVPYGDEGRNLINALCGAFDLSRERALLRKSQQYTINVLPRMLKRLEDVHAFHTIDSGRGIHCLLPEHYSDRFGLSADIVNLPEAYIC